MKRFAAIGAPSGHARCSLEQVTYARPSSSHLVTASLTVFVCECGRRFTVRHELHDHHNLEATLLASTIASTK